MHLSIDHEDITSLDPRRLQMVRAAAYFLLQAIGDIPAEDEAPPAAAPSYEPTGKENGAWVPSAAHGGMVHTSAPLPPTPVSNIPPPPPPPPVPTTDGDYDDETGEPHSNVVNGNFPQAGNVPPPPPSVDTAASNTPAPSLPATGAAAATGVVSAPEYDSAGMPWDARIHQKSKGKKKDNTW